jgi:hypothetical protein
MRWPEDHAAGELDRPGAHLADQVRPTIEPLDGGFSRALEVGENALKAPFMEKHPLPEVLRLKFLAHALEGRDVILQDAHMPSRQLTWRVNA